MEVEDHPVDPAVAAIEHAVDFWTPMLVRMGVAIGLFDAYGDRTAFPRDIAVEIEADSGVIGRVVRALATSGLFVSAGDGRYTLTATGARLRRGVPGSLALRPRSALR